MADVADHLQRPLLHAPLAGIEPDELHGDVEIAGRSRLPDLAEPAPAQQADQPVSGDRLVPGTRCRTPVVSPGGSGSVPLSLLWDVVSMGIVL